MCTDKFNGVPHIIEDRTHDELLVDSLCRSAFIDSMLDWCLYYDILEHNMSEEDINKFNRGLYGLHEIVSRGAAIVVADRDNNFMEITYESVILGYNLFLLGGNKYTKVRDLSTQQLKEIMQLGLYGEVRFK